MRSVERLATLAACQNTLVGNFEDAIRILDLGGAVGPKEPRTSENRPSWLSGLLRIRFPQHVTWTDTILAHISPWWSPPERSCCYVPTELRSAGD